jgi:hypothetical protein
MKPKSCDKCCAAGFDEDGENCLYCGAILSTRHEHDHFPIPKRHGGTQVWPVCLNCHDLKDRLDLRNWEPGMLLDGFESLPPAGKLLLGKLIAYQLDFKKKAGDD